MAKYGVLFEGPVEAAIDLAEAQNVYIEMGKLYRATLTVEGRYRGDEAVVEALRSLRSQYPNVIVNYLRVDPLGGDRYRVVIQFFDPQYGLFPVTAIVVAVIIALIVAALYEAHRIVEGVVEVIRAIGEEVRETVKTVSVEVGRPTAGLAVIAGAAGLGIGAGVVMGRVLRGGR